MHLMTSSLRILFSPTSQGSLTPIGCCLLPSFHLSIKSVADPGFPMGAPSPRVWGKNLLLPPANEVVGRYCFRRHVSLCPQGEGGVEPYPLGSYPCHRDHSPQGPYPLGHILSKAIPRQVDEQAVRILLECFLFLARFLSKTA